MIRLNNLDRSYDTKAGRTWVLRQVTLRHREGRFRQRDGPSGAGKSTFLEHPRHVRQRLVGASTG
jgi:ABC-type lipoprotein export system ATPase subunit